MECGREEAVFVVEVLARERCICCFLHTANLKLSCVTSGWKACGGTWRDSLRRCGKWQVRVSTNNSRSLVSNGKVDDWLAG